MGCPLKFSKILSVLSIAVFGYGAAHAATFSANQGGATGTSSVIAADGSGDYLSLADAATDFSNYSGGVQANYSFLIKTDLNEPASVAFGNNTNNKTVTLKPDSGTSVSVTFTATADNPGSGITGDIIIGSPSFANVANTVATNNFIIDGSNNGTDSRNLTIQHVREATAYSPRLVRIQGKNDNLTFKNITFLNRANRAAGMVFSIIQVADGNSENLQIINNHIEGTHVASQGVITGLSGTASDGVAIRNLLIEGNRIIAGQRPIFLGSASDVTINKNNISLNHKVSGYYATGIWHNTTNKSTGYTVNITNNLFDNNFINTIGTGTAHGATFIEAAPADSTGTYNIFNNVITGISTTTADTVTPFNALYRGISISGATLTANVYHNTVNMAHLRNFIASSTPTNIVGINLLNGVVSKLKNNIVVMGQETGALGIRYGNVSAAESDYNNVFVTPGSFFGRYDTTAQPTLADFQAASGREANSTSLDPNVVNAPGTGKWISVNDVRFDGNPGSGFEGTPLSEVTTDINGVTRSATAPTKGAYEYVVSSNVEGWQLY